MGNQLVQAGFVDGHLAPIEHRDLFPVDVATGDIVAHVRKPGACDKADIAGPDNTYLHVGLTLA